MESAAPTPETPVHTEPHQSGEHDIPASRKPSPLWLISVLLLVSAFVSLWLITRLTGTTQVAEQAASPAASPTPSLPVHQLIGSPSAPVKLTYAIHWTEPFQTDGIMENGKLVSKGLKHYLQEYVELHPEVAFQIQVISYADYATKLQLLHDAGIPPDIYQIYAPWGVSYVQNGILDEPPPEVIEDVRTQYVSVSGPTINDKIWGFPTEVNTYALIYNKDIFREAGISGPPTTFTQMADIAKKTTKYDDKGNIKQYGIAFLKGNDWQVVDPFLTWLFTNNGEYISQDQTKAMFNSPAGKEVLEAQVSLFANKVTDNNGNYFDFKDGKVAMVISPPWPKALIKEGFGPRFNSSVGIAPIPYFKKPATLQYSWFMGVMAKSKYKQQAWKFLTWFNTELQPATRTTRYGDFLVHTIGAIPSRKTDIDNHSAVLTDPFTKPFVDQIPRSIAEPNIPDASIIKKILMGQIEAVWAGQKTTAEALDKAALEVNALLSND